MTIAVQTSTLRTLLGNNTQNVVPRYQRRYSWQVKQFEELWGDVIARYKAVVAHGDDAARRHFLGAFVVTPLGDPDPLGFQRFTLIDGQQRLITLQLFLAAVRDVLTERGSDVWWSVTSSFLAHVQDRQIRDPRVLPGEADRVDFQQIVAGHEVTRTSRVNSAYRFFCDRLRKGFEPEAVIDDSAESLGSESPDTEDSPVGDVTADGEVDAELVLTPNDGFGVAYRLNDMLTALLDRIEHVIINLTPDENAYQVFQTLNARGTKLTQVDLLRNAFFVLVPTRGDALHEQVWMPMEAELGETGLQNFFHADLIRQGNNIPSKDIFTTQDGLLRRGGLDEKGIEQLLRDLCARAQVYRLLHAPDRFGSVGQRTLSEATRRGLRDLNIWGALPAHPVILEALIEWASDRVAEKEVKRLVDLVEAFLVRRFVVGQPPNGLRSLFATVMAKYASVEGPGTFDVGWFESELSLTSRRWPDDVATQRALLGAPLYDMGSGRQVFLILRRLAESLERKEGMPTIQYGQGKDLYSIEHLLPDGNGLTEAWREDLVEWVDDQPDLTWRDYRHTLGNLSLTIHNANVSNARWQDKRDYYQKHAGLELTRTVLSSERWTRGEITTRSADLAQRFVGIWMGPNRS